MLYFVSEDSNSAHDFWIKVLDVFVKEYKEINKNIDGNVISGNTSLESKVRSAISEAHQTDILFVAFDNISTICKDGPVAFDVKTFISNTKSECRKLNISFWITNYYCFEEVYMTYNELERLCRTDHRATTDDIAIKIADTLKYVRDCKTRDIDYWDKNNVHVQNIIGITKDAAVNKEHFADALLRHATKEIRHGLFSITKRENGLGACWIQSCEQLVVAKVNSKIGKKLEYFCSQCKYKCKNTCDKQKLIDINDNSILSEASIRFEDMERQCQKQQSKREVAIGVIKLES